MLIVYSTPKLKNFQKLSNNGIAQLRFYHSFCNLGIINVVSIENRNLYKPLTVAGNGQTEISRIGYKKQPRKWLHQN